MKLSIYIALKEIITACSSMRELDKCVSKYGYEHIPRETLFSIYYQELQRKMKRTFPSLSSEKQKLYYYEKFLQKAEKKEKHIILDMAKKYEMTPCILARFLIDVYLIKNGTPEEFDLPKNWHRRKVIGEIFRHPYKIPNKDLACAVQEAILVDDVYGPYTDKIKRALGVEFEASLRAWCKEQKLDFISEDDMRKDGYDKTPDVKLVVPIAMDGFVINWIESKAMFGDEECHTDHIRDQLGPYIHRFGPGLVIYWFGFIDALDCQRGMGIALADGLPKTFDKIDLEAWEKNLDWEFPKPPCRQPSTF